MRMTRSIFRGVVQTGGGERSRFFARAVGDEKAPAAVDAALWALAALLFAPLGVAAFLAYKAFEKSRAPPKRVVSQPEKKKKSKKRD